MALNDFLTILSKLSPVLVRLPLLGHVEPYDLEGRPLDSYVRPTTILAGAAGPVWRRDGKGWYFGQLQSLAAGGGAIVITDSGAAPELRATSGTIFWTARSFQAVVGDVNHEIVSKIDAGGIHLSAFIGAAGRVSLYDGAVSSAMISASISGARTLVVRYVAGAVPQLFTDGVYRVNGTVAVNPSGNDADLYLANNYQLNKESRRNDYGCFVIFNDAILGRGVTDQEIAELHEAYESMESVFVPEKTISLPPDPIQITGSLPLVRFRGEKNPNSLIPNKGSLVLDFTVSGGPLTTHTERGHVIHSAHGKGGATGPLIQSPVDAGLYPDPWTISFKCLVRSRGEGASGYMFMFDSAGSRTRAYPAGVPVTILYYIVLYADGEAAWSFPCTPNVWHVVTIRHTKSNPVNLPVVWVNGEAAVVTVVTPRAGALSAAPTPRLTLFNYSNPAAASKAFDGDIEIFRVDTGLLSDAQVRKIYLEHASETTKLAEDTSFAVSPVASVAGASCGPYRTLSGTHKWSSIRVGDKQFRGIMGITAGYFTAREANPQAYGAWYCRMLKGTDAGTVWMPMISNLPKMISAADFNGYVLGFTNIEAVTLWKYTAGVAANVVATGAGAIVINTPYELFVTRRKRDGLFTVWIGGGAYVNFTNLMSGTDNTFITSAHPVGYVDGGGYVGDYRSYPNGDTLLPSEIPWL